MYKLRTLALALLLTSLVIAPAFAKRHGGNGPCDYDGKGMGQIEQLKLVLDLTPQQETEIKEIFAESREEMAPLREKKHVNKEAIHSLVDADVLDEPRLRELLREQTELHADMMVARHATQARVNKILSPEQQEKRKALRQQRMGHKGSRRCAEPAACNS